jgi:hypothetical protein
VLAAFAFMGVALFVWVTTGSLIVFALAVVVQTAVFFTAIVVPEAYAAPQPGGELDPAASAAPARASS